MSGAREVLDRDGAVLFTRRLGEDALRDLRPLADARIGDRPGARLTDEAGLGSLLASDGAIGAVAAALTSPAARAVRAVLFDKSPDANWAVAWHQDRTIPVRDRIAVEGFGPWSAKDGVTHVAPPFEILARMVTLRVHLDDVDADNAPLRVAVGSHRLGRAPAEEAADRARAMEQMVCLAEAGDVWAYRTPILHASDRASGDRRRRVLQVDYADFDLPGGLEWRGFDRVTALDRRYWIEARFERREGWDDGVYPFNLPVVRTTDTLAFHPRVTFVVGENGAGKSTLIEALAVAWGFNAEGGSTGMQFQTRGSHSPLHRFIRPVRSAAHAKDGYFLRAESFFNAASYIEETGVSGYGPRRLHEQSHGESFFTLFDERFRGEGLYILDEPEAALSPSRQLSFLARMHELVMQKSQFIIATHSPIILGYPDAWIYQASAHGLERVEYEDTEHFQITRGFLNRRETYLDVLLDPE